MKPPSAMSENPPSNDATAPDDAVRCTGIRERILLGLVLFTLVRTGEALAGDQASIANSARDPDPGNSHESAPSAPAMMAFSGPFGAPAFDGARVFSATEFRPRKSTAINSDTAVSAFGDAPLLRSTTVWQRLSEYRSQNRVRLLTLWESRGSSVSLQTGTRGNPSLQWSSRLTNRGGSTQGVLDRLFSVSIGGGSSGGQRGNARPNYEPPTSKPINTPAVAAVK